MKINKMSDREARYHKAVGTNCFIKKKNPPLKCRILEYKKQTETGKEEHMFKVELDYFTGEPQWTECKNIDIPKSTISVSTAYKAR